MVAIISVPAELDEADIERYAVLRGKCNSLPVVLGGHTYEPHSIRFLTFAGELRGEKYVGVYRFERGPCQGDDAADLNQLPGLAHEEHADGV